LEKTFLENTFLKKVNIERKKFLGKIFVVEKLKNFVGRKFGGKGIGEGG